MLHTGTLDTSKEPVCNIIEDGNNIMIEFVEFLNYLEAHREMRTAIGLKNNHHFHICSFTDGYKDNKT